MNHSKTVILYERLSRDDDTDSESNSIKNQKILLEEYATRNGMTNFIHITDDGVSGLRFDDRPGYVRMMEEVEDGNVSVILVKDITRLGRDYLRVGMCMEQLRISGVRLIALGDGIDTAKGEDDFTPFRTVMAEFYAKDTSRKIKSAYKAKSASGKPVTSYPPYGYLKSPEDKCKWVVDEEAAAVVRRIFQLTMEAKGPYQICCILKEDKVPIPAYHLAQKGAGLHQSYDFPDPYRWGSSTVCAILSKKEYLGHTCNFKTRKHFKDRKSHYVDESEWTIIENTHEPIIDQETFNNVQRLRGGIKRRPDGWGYAHPLSGLLFCADCGGKLHVHRTYNGKDKPTCVCCNYAKGSAVLQYGVVCNSGHRIDAATVMELVRDTIKAIADYAKIDKAGFIKSVQETLASQQTTEIKKQKKRLVICEKRTAELEVLFKKIYEDYALKKLPDNRYEALSNDYAQEQDILEKEIAELEKSVGSYEDGSTRAKHFIHLVGRYTDFTELTIPMLNEFVNKIIVHERDRKGAIDSTQKVEIHLNFIGEYLPPMLKSEGLTPEQEEEQREILERRARFRRAYERRVETGKQKEYYERTKYKKRAKYDADKTALLEDGVVLGATALAPVPLSVAVNQ